jgi:murein DD-endopeptidase MepM/ murein hydrolase activator NlpD
MEATTIGPLLLLLIILVGFAMMIGGPRAVRGLIGLILLPVRLLVRPVAVVLLAVLAVAVALTLFRPAACARIGGFPVAGWSASPAPARTAPPPTSSLSGLLMPLSEGAYRVGQPFLGTSLSPELLHLGQDYGVPRATSDGRALSGTLLYAMGEGRVVAARYGVPAHSGDGVGNYVTVDHGAGRIAVYMHLARVWVAEGNAVHARSLLGEAGDVLLHPCPDYCPHLHLEVRALGDRALNVPPNLRYSYASRDGRTRFSRGFDSEEACLKWIGERFLDPGGLSPRPESMSPRFDVPDAIRALLDAGYRGWRPATVSLEAYGRCLDGQAGAQPHNVTGDFDGDGTEDWAGRICDAGDCQLLVFVKTSQGGYREYALHATALAESSQYLSVAEPGASYVDRGTGSAGRFARQTVAVRTCGSSSVAYVWDDGFRAVTLDD